MRIFQEYDRFLFLQGAIFELIFWISLFQCSSPFTLKPTGIPSSFSESVVNFMLSPSPLSLFCMLNPIFVQLRAWSYSKLFNNIYPQGQWVLIVKQENSVINVLTTFYLSRYFVFIFNIYTFNIRIFSDICHKWLSLYYVEKSRQRITLSDAPAHRKIWR